MIGLLVFRENDLILSAQVHESEEAEKTVIICIEISVLIRLILRVPETIDELTADLMIAKKRCCRYSRNETYRMAEDSCPATCRKDIPLFRKTSVYTVLVNECIDALVVEEVLDLLAILSLPLLVRARP